jgi:hypothetical protein
MTEVLVHWKNRSHVDATWEFTDDFKIKYPDFNLEGKVELQKRQLSYHQF